MANNKMLRGVSDWDADILGAASAATSGLTIGRCNYALGSGTNTVSLLAINGGAIRMLGDTNEAADMVLSGPLVYQLNKCGKLTLQARIRVITSIAASAVFVGMWNAVTTGQLSYEDASIVSSPTDGFGVFIEPEQSATHFDNWSTIGTGNNVNDTVQYATNLDVPLITTFYTLKIEADSTNGYNGSDVGTIRFQVWVDGVLLDSAGTDSRGWTTTLCRSSQVLAPVISRAGRGTAYSVDVAEFHCNGAIGDALD